MRIGNGFLLIVCAWLLTACAGPDPAIKAALDQRIALIRPSEVAYAAPRMASIRPLKTGQWVQTKRVDLNGAVSLTTIKIMGQEGPAFWTEIVRENHEGRNVIQILVDYGDSMDPTTGKMLSMKIKDGQGRVMEKDTGGSLIDWLPNILNVRRWDGFPQEDLQVRGGRFAKAYRGTFDVDVLFLTSKGIAWWHPAVPITGTVKIVGDGHWLGGTTELVAFGENGAISEF